MTLEADLAAWVATRPPWQQDVLALVALRDLTGVNALAPDQTLTFGLTVVYSINVS